MPLLPPVTKALLLTLVAVFCVQELLPALTQWLALWPVAGGNFYPWQVGTYALLHGDVVHLLFNSLSLWMFGTELERLWGPRRFMHFIAASVLAAAAVQLVWTFAIGSPAPTLGASGATFGLLLGFGMKFPDRIIMPLFPPIPMKAKYFVMVFGALELFFGMNRNSGIAHFAHLGGMLGGFLMIQYWAGKPPFPPNRPKRPNNVRNLH
jgi:membrane associated rhomboid family serine protease